MEKYASQYEWVEPSLITGMKAIKVFIFPIRFQETPTTCIMEHTLS